MSATKKAAGALVKKAAVAAAKRAAKTISKKTAVAPRKGLFPGWPGKIGGFLGSILGPTGKEVGKEAGDWLGSITGLGDYKVNRNSIMTDTGPPGFRDSSNGSIRVTHREFIGNVTSSTSFAMRFSQYINPTNTTLFPWLSSIANAYDQHEWEGLVFTFKTTSGTAVASTNTALGTVIMATNYDVYDNPFTTKVAMENYQFCTSGVPFQNVLHPVECKRTDTTVNVLYNDTDGGSGDLRMNNLGRFQLATSGQQASDVVLGELWVTYDIKLLKPKLIGGSNAAPGVGTALYYRAFFGGGASSGASIIDWSIAQTVNTTTNGNVIPYSAFSPGVAKQGFYVLQPGLYIGWWWATANAGDALAITAGSPSAGNGIVVSFLQSFLDTTNGRALYYFTVQVNDPVNITSSTGSFFTLGTWNSTIAHPIETQMFLYPDFGRGNTYIPLPLDTSGLLLSDSDKRRAVDKQLAELKLLREQFMADNEACVSVSRPTPLNVDIPVSGYFGLRR